MTLEEKIASVPKLERIDSSIESCIKILEQELNKRREEDPYWALRANMLLVSLGNFKNNFNDMTGKK